MVKIMNLLNVGHAPTLQSIHAFVEIDQLLKELQEMP